MNYNKKYYHTHQAEQVFVTVDAEWNNESFLSLQVGVFFENKPISKGFFANKLYLSKETQKTYEILGSNSNTEVFFIEPVDTENILENYIQHIVDTKLKAIVQNINQVTFTLLFFYSPKDLIYSFGFNNIEPFFKEKFPKNLNSNWIVQLRSIFGRIKFNYKFSCKDLAGFTNSSLLTLASSYGVEMPTKTSLDDYKDRMEIPFCENPEDFFTYGMSDTLSLYTIFLNIVNQTNKLLKETLDFPDFLLFSKENFPSSNGKLISEIFLKYFIFWSLRKPKTKEEYLDRKLRLNTAFAKQSLLQTSSSKYKENVKVWNKIFKNKCLDSALDYIKKNKLEDHPVIDI